MCGGARGGYIRSGHRGVSLRTTYLGFDLPHPLIVGASPLSEDLDTGRELEDAGAAPSLHAFATQPTSLNLGRNE